MKSAMFSVLAFFVCLAVGCEVMPTVRVKPTLHNPYPQLTEVAVVPFFNRTGGNEIDGRDCARLYAQELQRIPGYRVTAQSRVESAMLEHELTRFESADDIRRLGTILGVEAVIVGSVNDFHAYYPSRLALDVEWYAVNPYLHPIPAGHGLPWGTPDESQIPDRILIQAEHALARAQLQTQTPDIPVPQNPEKPVDKLDSVIQQVNFVDGDTGNIDFAALAKAQQDRGLSRQLLATGVPYITSGESQQTLQAPPAPPVLNAVVPEIPPLAQGPDPSVWSEASRGMQYLPNLPPELLAQYAAQYGTIPSLPANWPDPRGFVPDGPQGEKPKGEVANTGPVIQHAAVYNANDRDFTQALADYHLLFRDDKRIDGWQGMLENQAEFVSFCCRMHIWETLTARGGAGKAETVTTTRKLWFGGKKPY